MMSKLKIWFGSHYLEICLITNLKACGPCGCGMTLCSGHRAGQGRGGWCNITSVISSETGGRKAALHSIYHIQLPIHLEQQASSQHLHLALHASNWICHNVLDVLMFTRICTRLFDLHPSFLSYKTAISCLFQ